MTMNNNSDETNALLKKIKKLMALATSPNENEAKLAAEKAQELILRHNLSIQHIQLNLDYTEETVGKTTKIKKEHSFILHILNQHFFVKTYFDREFNGYNRGGKRTYRSDIQIVGTPSNVAVARYVFEYLMEVYGRLWKEYQKKTGCPTSSKYAYMWGLTEGIKSRLEVVKEKVQTETGLVLVADSGLVKHMDEKGLTSRRSATHRRDDDAHSDGVEHGKKVQIARALNSENKSSGLALGYKG